MANIEDFKKMFSLYPKEIIDISKNEDYDEHPDRNPNIISFLPMYSEEYESPAYVGIKIRLFDDSKKHEILINNILERFAPCKYHVVDIATTLNVYQSGYIEMFSLTVDINSDNADDPELSIYGQSQDYDGTHTITKENEEKNRHYISPRCGEIQRHFHNLINEINSVIIWSNFDLNK